MSVFLILWINIKNFFMNTASLSPSVPLYWKLGDLGKGSLSLQGSFFQRNVARPKYMQSVKMRSWQAEGSFSPSPL